MRDLLALTAAGCLLALSFATIYYCRKTRVSFTSEAAFLFSGLGRAASLASNTGAVFSVTYFFGATFIYAAVFRGWIRIATAVVFVAVVALTLAVTRRLYDAGTIGPAGKGNPLLLFMHSRMDERHFHDLVRIYTTIYFALLVEELAVSRLVLYTLIPHPIVVGLLLVVLVFVIYTYLHLGGFRAVLAADSVQMTVLVVFTALLVLLVFSRGSPSAFFVGPLERQPPANILNLCGSVLFGLSWFAAGVDFYSRLNFSTARQDAHTYREFVIASCIAAFILLLIGTAFGDFLSRRLTVRAPSSYVAEAVDFFLREPLFIAIVFVVAVFAMIFTTINTLLLLNLQVGHYQPKRAFRRQTLLHIIVAAVVISTRMSFDSVSAVGIFMGSLMVLPLIAILRVIWPKQLRFLPVNPRYLLYAMVVATIVFIVYYYRIVVRFDRHFYLTLLVASAAVVCASTSWVVTWFRRERT